MGAHAALKSAGKKRGRKPNPDKAANTNGSNKKVKKEAGEPHPLLTSPPPAAEPAWTPPEGNWEDHIKSIDTIWRDGDMLKAAVTWNTAQNYRKAEHQTHVLHKRCPQKMLKFYESHLYISPSS